MFGLQRESKRYSHGHHLTPQDANPERIRRSRYKSSPDGKERRRHSSERGYRSDNEPRRRHRHDEERDRYRASSSHRSRDDDRRRQDSSTDTEGDLVRERIVWKPRNDGDHVYSGMEITGRHHRQRRSNNQRYGEHRFDDSSDKRLIYPAPIPTISGVSPPSLARNASDQIRDHDQVQGWESTELPLQKPEEEIYGDQHYEDLVQSKASSRWKVHMSHEQPYGEHRFDDEQVTKARSTRHFEDVWHTVNLSRPQPTNDLSSNSISNHEDSAIRTGSRIDIAEQAFPSPTNRQRIHRMSLPSRVRDSTSTFGDRSPQDHFDNRPSTSGPSEACNANAKLPRLSISQYHTDYSQPLPNIVTPDGSRSEADGDRQRSRSGSGASITSSRIPSRSPSLSGSGVLGPKTYQYQPLQASEIRLVRVLPERMWKLKCEIFHVSLDNAPEYTAISYAWGDGVDTRPLILEGATIPVAVNLHDALRAVRRKKEEILVWVDALCIDQQNKEERATQVRLMGQIYSNAASVAIWIGPEYEESALALQLLQKVAQNTIDSQYIKSTSNSDSLALFNLFKRDYWKRLWVVQEVLLADNKMVYCGCSVFPWEVYQKASEVFWDKDSDPHIRQGPSSFPDRDTLKQLGDESLLEVMRACRKKLSENSRDKVFGILGLLSDATQRDFPVDYSQSVKAVYTDVVDHLISTTDKLDVIREAIHFPLHVNSTGLPSWCPDWSHIPEVSGLGRTLNFAASSHANGPTKAQYWFHDERRKLEISAIRIDAVMATGVAVGTFCAAQDYLTAFLQWRAVLLHEINIQEGNESHPMHTTFCRTLCLGQVPLKWNQQSQTWRDLCYHVFAALIRERMPRLPMDEDLKRYADATGLIEPKARRKFLQDHFGNRMMGRSLCITEGGLIGMGSGYMTAKDVVVVPFGCSTPILLRPEGRGNEYRYVGDVYIDGYMHGEAIAQMEAKDPKRVVLKYMLC